MDPSLQPCDGLHSVDGAFYGAREKWGLGASVATALLESSESVDSRRAPGIAFDEQAARRIEAIYLTPDVVEQRCRTLRTLNARPGERALDASARDRDFSRVRSGRLCVPRAAWSAST